MNTPKYPRVIVSGKRHDLLAREAQARDLTIAEVAEEKLAAAGAYKFPKKRKK